jgi:hypothetical protein
MQRGGKWDNTDVKGAKNKKNWLSSDKEYASGGFKREQSVSILGSGGGLDWTGNSKRVGPGEISVRVSKFEKNYKAPNANTIKGTKKDNKNNEKDPPKKKFGWF